MEIKYNVFGSFVFIVFNYMGLISLNIITIDVAFLMIVPEAILLFILTWFLPVSVCLLACGCFCKEQDMSFKEKQAI